MLRLLPGAVLVCLHLSVSSISAQNRDEFVRPFQEEILRVPALDTQSRFDPGLPYFGKGRAFIASGYLKDGVVAFNLQPNSRDYLRIEKGLARVSYPANKWLTQRLLESVRRYSGPVAIGDVIPLFGALYRITDFRQEDNGGKGTEIILQRVEAGDWPDGITLDPFAYPVLTGGGLNVSNLTPIDIHSVTFDEKANQFRLTVVHQYIKPWREFRASEVAWREETFPVSPGSLVTLNMQVRQVHFRVVSVVLPDKRNHIPGWVELRQLWPTVRPFGIRETLKIR